LDLAAGMFANMAIVASARPAKKNGFLLNQGMVN